MGCREVQVQVQVVLIWLSAEFERAQEIRNQGKDQGRGSRTSITEAKE